MSALPCHSDKEQIEHVAPFDYDLLKPAKLFAFFSVAFALMA